MTPATPGDGGPLFPQSAPGIDPVKLQVRLDGSLHEELVESAKRNHRSLNAEILDRLQTSRNPGWIGGSDVTLRDYFIAHAPAEAPTWFQPAMPTQRPEEPRFPGEHGQSKDHASYVREYASVMNPEEAKADVLQQYVRDVQAWRPSVSAWDAEHARETYLQWPAAWADEMLKRRQS